MLLPGVGAPRNSSAGCAVIALQLGRAKDPVGRGEGRERHHFTPAVAHVPKTQVLRQHARVDLALHEYPLDAVAIDELVDVGRAPAGAQGIVDGADRKTERARLFPVDVELVLRLIRETIWPYQADRRVLAREPQQLAARFHQPRMTYVAAILQLEVESVALPSSSAAGGANATTNAPRIWWKRRLARSASAKTEFFFPGRSDQSFRRTNMRPVFCPCRPKLKPLTVNTPLTRSFSSLRK